MKRWLNGLILFSFGLWLVPVGALVDASKEATVCGGQRAVCLCHVASKNKTPSAAKTTSVRAGGVEKEAGSPGSNGTEFLVLQRFSLVSSQSAVFQYSQDQFYLSALRSPADPVPKV